MFQGTIFQAEDVIRSHPDRARLLRAVGQDWNGKEVWTLSEPLLLQSGDGFLICSDGVWEWVTGGRMEEFLPEAESAEEWLSKVEAEALRQGQGKGMDNYSEICVLIHD